MQACDAYLLGQIGYKEAYNIQTRFMENRIAGYIKDTLLLLEHPHTITIGKSGNSKNILVSNERLKELGISLFLADRGGDVTYHGPGQLVGYPIIDLKNRGKDIRKYVHDIEEVIINTLRVFSIESSRSIYHPGVWVNNCQIAAIGLRIKKCVTMHGFSLNVNTNLDVCSLINPCGCSNVKVISCSKILSRDIPIDEVINVLLIQFSDIFDFEIKTNNKLT